MSKIGGKNILSVEFKIFIVILAIAVLNNILLANLSDKSENIYTFFTSVPLSFSVYLLYIIASCFGIIFKMGKFLRWIFMGLLAFMTYHIFVNLVELILNKQISQNGEAILLDALIIWLSSLLVFSLWYWIVDRNGPVARELAEN